MELYCQQAREGLDLYTPQDRHDAYRALGIKVIAHADGSTELTGSLPADIHGDSMRMILTRSTTLWRGKLRYRG